MNDNLIRLAERRARLTEQAATQRRELAQDVEPWRHLLARADTGLAVLRYLRDHPSLLIGGGILLAVLRPGRVWQWLGRGWVTFQMISKFRG